MAVPDTFVTWVHTTPYGFKMELEASPLVVEFGVQRRRRQPRQRAMAAHPFASVLRFGAGNVPVPEAFFWERPQVEFTSLRRRARTLSLGRDWAAAADEWKGPPTSNCSNVLARVALTLSARSSGATTAPPIGLREASFATTRKPT